MTLKRRLQQIEAASIVTEGYQPMTAICRAIVDHKGQAKEWLMRGLGVTPEERADHTAAAVEDFIAQSGKPASAFDVSQQDNWAAIAPAIGAA
jgi:hypothetical protein